MPNIVLELENEDEIEGSEIVIFKLSDKKVVIGASEDADLCIVDRRLDAYQCSFFLDREKKKVLIGEESVWYETLIKLKDQTVFEPKIGIKLHIQNLKLELSKEKKFLDFLCKNELYTIIFDQR